jgi:outer membrane protein TolC
MPRAVPSHVRLVTTVFVALAATGCMVGPNYARPPLAPPPQFRFAEGAQAESLADAPWFQIFDDPSLQNLIKEAIANNLDLKVAVAWKKHGPRGFREPSIKLASQYGVQASNAQRRHLRTRTRRTERHLRLSAVVGSISSAVSAAR